MVPHPATMATRASSSKGPWLNHLDGLSQQFDVLIEIDGLGDNDRRDKKFLKILRDICTVVHDAEKRAAPGLPEIVEEAYTVLASCSSMHTPMDSSASSNASPTRTTIPSSEIVSRWPVRRLHRHPGRDMLAN